MGDSRWPEELRRLLELVLERGRALPRDAFDAWLADAAATRAPRVARERFASGTGVYELDVAEALRPDGDIWLEVEPDDGRWVRVAYDADGALAVATEHAWGEASVVAVGDRDDDGTVWLVGRCSWHAPQVAARRTTADGTVLVAAAVWTGPAGDPPEVVVSATTPPESGRARSLRAQLLASDDGTWPGRVISGVDELRLDATGRPIERWIDRPDRWDAEAGEQPSEIPDEEAIRTDPLAMLDATVDALPARAAVATPVLWWSARLHDPPARPPDPWEPLDAAAVGRAAEGLRDAVVAAAATSTLPTPCAVCLEWKTGETERPDAMPNLVVVDRAFRAASARRPPARPALHRTHVARQAGEGQRIALGPFADDDTLDAWRRLQHAYGVVPGVSAAQRAGAGQDLARVRRRAVALLLDQRWPAHWDDQVVPWLTFGPPVGGGVAEDAGVSTDAELRELAPGVYGAFERLWPTKARVAESEWTLLDDDDDDGPDAPGRPGVRSREELRARLEDDGLAEAAAPLAAAARWGWVLAVGDDGSAGRTRIGGPPLLPPDAPWPTAAAGAPLTYVAAIDLAAAPVLPEPVVLPTEGLLLVYLLVGETERDDGVLDFVEHEPAEEAVRVFLVPPGTDPVTVDAPGAPLLRRAASVGGDGRPVDRPVTLRSSLMPLCDYGVGERFGLHPLEAEHYADVAWGLRGDDRWAIATLLGADPGAQGHGEDEDEIVLLGIDGTAAVGLDWGDGGDVRVLIDRAAATAGRWEQAYVVADSG